MRNQKPTTRRSTRRAEHAEAPAGPPRRTGRPVRPADVRRTRSRILICLYLLLAAECAVALFTSPWLEVQRIGVDGAVGLPPAEAEVIRSRAAGIAHSNWLRAPIGSLEGSLKRLPWIAQARVTRRFPDGVRVQVRPREPMFVAQVGANSYELDTDGVPIRLARPVTAALPVVILPESTPVRCGETIDDEALRAVVKIVVSTRKDAVIRIAKIEVDPSHNLCLNMEDGLPIRIGQPETLEEKIALLRRIYTRRPNIARLLAAIDVTCPSAPACTLRKPTAEAAGGNAPEPGRFE